MVSPDFGGVDVKHSSHLQLLVNMDTKRTMAKVSIAKRDRSRARFRVFLQALYICFQSNTLCFAENLELRFAASDSSWTLEQFNDLFYFFLIGCIWVCFHDGYPLMLMPSSLC
jgi:hypothetical protein